MTKDEIKSIVDIITQLHENLEPVFVETLVQRLLCFGYKTLETDSWCLVFGIDKATNKIKNSCNITDIPKELTEVLIDRICGEFLFMKKQSNQLTLDNIDLDMAVKSLQEGDTKIDFAIGDGSQTDETRFNSLINYLMNLSGGDLVCYRKLKW